jgi:hypothetical protein
MIGFIMFFVSQCIRTEILRVFSGYRALGDGSVGIVTDNGLDHRGVGV